MMHPDPATATVTELVARLGLGFHPDLPIDEYVTCYDGEVVGPTFSPSEVARLQEGLDLAHLVYGEAGIFEIVSQLEPWASFISQDPGAPERPDTQPDS